MQTQALSPVMQMLQNHIAAHTTYGEEWPADAEFAVAWRTSTWPCGWSDIRHIDFFASKQELDAWMDKQRKWASYEDNYVAWEVYEWDLGPTRRYDLDRSSGNV